MCAPKIIALTGEDGNNVLGIVEGAVLVLAAMVYGCLVYSSRTKGAGNLALIPNLLGASLEQYG